jgi:hypothetical protein
MTSNVIERNNDDFRNGHPTAPTTLQDSIRNNYLYMYWAPATDGVTPSAALTYQVYVGDQSGKQNIISSNAELTTGRQVIQQPGTANKLWKVKIPSAGTYYWGVQSIDGAWFPSSFAHHTTTTIYLEGEVRSCTNTVQKYKVSPAGSYTFMVKGGTIQRKSADEIEIIWNAEGFGTISASNGSVKNTLDVRIVEKPAPIIAGETWHCENSASQPYATPMVATHQYAWTVDGGEFLRTPNTSEVLVKWDKAGERTLHVFETSVENVCTIEQVLPISIKAAPAPEVKGTSILCKENPLQTYQIQSQTGNTIEWQVFGGDIIGSNSGSALSVRWHDQAIGRISVTESNAQCSTNDILEVDLNTLIFPDIDGEFVVCGNQLAFKYTTSAHDGYSYQWTVENGKVKGSVTASTISVLWQPIGTGKIIIEQRRDDCVLKDSVYINIYPRSLPIVITEQGPATFGAPVGSSYEWFMDGNPIAGATEQTLHLKEAGAYSVVVTDLKGCTMTSETKLFPVMATEDPELSLKVYPNPVKTHLFIEMENQYQGTLRITIRDMLGRVVQGIENEKTSSYFSQKLDVSALSAGMMFLDIEGENFVIRKKFLTSPSNQ